MRKYLSRRSTETLIHAELSQVVLTGYWLYSEYAVLTYGNMPVYPRLRVKILLKFKYENVV